MPNRPNISSRHTQIQHQDTSENVRQQKQPPSNPTIAKTATSRDLKRKQSADHQRPSLSTPEDSIPVDDKLLTYYPAYCHKSSPTWFEWIKLTAHDIHTKLRIKDGYQHSWLTEHRSARDAPQIMFYLNHPIQFVQVVGIVVAFDEYFDRFWLFTIDDSSGLTIDVVCRKPAKEKSETQKADIAALGQKDEAMDEEEKQILQLSNLVASTVELGSVLQVKGVVTLFRRNRAPVGFTDLIGGTTSNKPPEEIPTRQISLQRLVKVHDTNQEISLIAARTQFSKSVLSRPWALSDKEQRKLHKEALGEVEHDKKRAKRSVLKRQRLIEIEKEDTEAIQAEYAKEEQRREEAAEAVRQAGQKLQDKLDREKQERGNDEKSAPKPIRSVAAVRLESVSGRDCNNKRSHKRRKNEKLTQATRETPTVEQNDTTNESFAALDEEKSALLKLAFG